MIFHIFLFNYFVVFFHLFKRSKIFVNFNFVQIPDDELAGLIQEAENKPPEELTEEDKMALLGRPKNGDIVRAQLRVKESKEFKVSFKLK